MEITLQHFFNWLSRQAGTVETPMSQFIKYWGNAKGYRVSGSRFESGFVVISHRYAYKTEHSVEDSVLFLNDVVSARRYWTVEELRAEAEKASRRYQETVEVPVTAPALRSLSEAQEEEAFV